MKIQIPINLKKSLGLNAIFDEPTLFQCHHYNVLLQKILLDQQDIDMKAVLIDSATTVCYSQLNRIYDLNQAKTLEEKLALANGLFKMLGFGLVDFSNLVTDGIVSVKNSHYALGWKEKFGQSNFPVCFFVTGFIAGLLASVKGEPIGSYAVVEEECMAFNNEEECKFSILKLPSPKSISKSPQIGSVNTDRIKRNLSVNIEEKNIVNTLTKMEIKGNEKGIIPTFGINITRHYANYYNLISYSYSEKLNKSDKDPAAESLTKVAHLGSFYTLGSIMTSNEWNGLIYPNIIDSVDWVHGIIAWINSLGWGIWDVKEIVPEEGLVINLNNGYESNGYLSLYGSNAKYPKCYMATGSALSIMDLLYNIDITSQPTLNEELYQKIVDEDRYMVEETMCRAKGDPHCQIVVTRK